MASLRSPVFQPAAFTALVLAASVSPAVADVVYVTNTSRQHFTLEMEAPPPGGGNAPVLASTMDGRVNQASLVELVNGGDSVFLPSGATLVLLFADRPSGQVHDFEQVVLKVVNDEGRTAATLSLWQVFKKGTGTGATWRSILPEAKGAGFLAPDAEHLVITGEW
jgi:hypothetical protein